MDDLGDRMKFFEGMEADRKLLPLIPAMARLDGKCFHSFTRGMKRPFDSNMVELMQKVTEFMVAETNASIGYTQSDEISLTWKSDDIRSQIFFDGRIQKMVGILSAKASVEFNRLLPDFFPNKVKLSPIFDCRVWNVPTETEAANTFLWRELDATKNSISMAAQAYFSHKELMGKNGSEKQEMLHQKGINWNDYPSYFKRGTFIQKRKSLQKFTAEEIGKLPLKHAARGNPELMIERNQIRKLEVPPFNQVINRVGVIFRGEDPVTHKSGE